VISAIFLVPGSGVLSASRDSGCHGLMLETTDPPSLIPLHQIICPPPCLPVVTERIEITVRYKKLGTHSLWKLML